MGELYRVYCVGVGKEVGCGTRFGRVRGTFKAQYCQKPKCTGRGKTKSKCCGHHIKKITKGMFKDPKKHNGWIGKRICFPCVLQRDDIVWEGKYSKTRKDKELEVAD